MAGQVLCFSAFNLARGHQIERANYLEALKEAEKNRHKYAQQIPAATANNAASFTVDDVDDFVLEDVIDL